MPGKVDYKEKIEFLRTCKFVVAFENSSAPGYNTEKLTHAIEADCLPIYWGDPQVGRSYNTRRFINAHDFLPKPISFLPRLPYAPYSLQATDRPSVSCPRREEAQQAEQRNRTARLGGERF